MLFTPEELSDFKTGIFPSKWRKYTLNYIEDQVSLFVDGLRKDKMYYYTKTQLISALWGKFTNSVIRESLEWDYGLFHDLFLDPHNLVFISDGFNEFYSLLSIGKVIATESDHAIIKSHDILEKSKQFANFLVKKSSNKYKKSDLYSFFWDHFVKNVIVRIFKSDVKLFHEIFLKQHNLKFVVTQSFKGNGKRILMDNFFDYLHSKSIKIWNPLMLYKYNPSFYSTVIHKIYNHDRDKFFLDIWLRKEDTWFYIKNPRILTEDIIQNKVNEFIERIKKMNLDSFSPITISQINRTLYENLIRLYRMADWKVDWLYILVRYFKSNEYYSLFRHRTDIVVNWKDIFVKSFKDYSYNQIADDSLNPEELLIRKENWWLTESESQIDDELYELYKNALSVLPNEDRGLIERFLNWEDIWDAFLKIVAAIQNNLGVLTKKF